MAQQSDRTIEAVTRCDADGGLAIITLANRPFREQVARPQP